MGNARWSPTDAEVREFSKRHDLGTGIDLRALIDDARSMHMLSPAAADKAVLILASQRDPKAVEAEGMEKEWSAFEAAFLALNGFKPHPRDSLHAAHYYYWKAGVAYASAQRSSARPTDLPEDLTAYSSEGDLIARAGGGS